MRVDVDCDVIVTIDKCHAAWKENCASQSVLE